MTKFPTLLNALNCEYFSLCSGCVVNKNLSLPPSFSFLQNFTREFFPSVIPDLHFKKAHDWRIKSKLAVRLQDKEIAIGLFKKNSHEVIDIPHCRVHHPLINKCVIRLKKLMKEWGIRPYQEKEHKGDLRYLQFLVNDQTQKVQLTLVMNSDKMCAEWAIFLEKLSLDPSYHSIWINYQNEKNNIILSNKWDLYTGSPYFPLPILDHIFYFHPACFAQANIGIFEEMISHIREKMKPNSHVIELFSGVGVIGLLLLDKAQSLEFFEINPYAKDCFEKSVESIEECLKRKIHFHLKDLKTSLGFHNKEVLVVDPPRKGLAKELKDSICKSSHLKQLIYVSCGLESFFRDCKELKDKNWKLTSCDAFVMFPGTDHIETIAIFQRD